MTSQVARTDTGLQILTSGAATAASTLLSRTVVVSEIVPWRELMRKVLIGTVFETPHKHVRLVAGFERND